MTNQHNSGRHPRPLFALVMAALTVAVLLALLLQAFVVQAYSVPSASMSPTLRVGDRVLVDKLSLLWRPVRRGDIVVFDGTDVWTPAGNGTLIAKRVIALAGDHVACCDAMGRIRLNGRPLQEPYAHGANRRFDVVVPAGRLWVLGDARSRSLDSSAFTATPGGGSVPVNHVIGRVFAVAWPPNHAGILGTPGPKEPHDAA